MAFINDNLVDELYALVLCLFFWTLYNGTWEILAIVQSEQIVEAVNKMMNKYV